jgi:hypothetical protein
MAVQYSTSVRNAMLDTIESTIGTAARLQIWTGSQPANCATAASGTKLVDVTLASDWAAAASSGSKAFNNTPISTTAVAAGTCGYYRIVDNAGTTCHEQGSVTATGGGGDMTIDNAVLANGQAVQITGFTKTAPGA